MYGVLLEAVEHYIKKTYGEEMWDQIRKFAHVDSISFSSHKRYAENIIPDIARACSLILEINEDDVMDAFGVSFISFVGQYGYDRILSVLGRNMRDFLNGLDNLHEYLRFSYPKLKPPSFFCTNESTSGLTLHYRSRRKGFLHYVKGQIRQVGIQFYKIEVNIDVVSVESRDSMTHVVFRLYFDNAAYKEELIKRQVFASSSLPLDSSVFFNLFPFHVVFTRSLEIRGVGAGIAALCPNAKGEKMNKFFGLVRPLVEFKWDEIIAHTNNVFELKTLKLKNTHIQCENVDEQMVVSTEESHRHSKLASEDADSDNSCESSVDIKKQSTDTESSDDEDKYFIHLKGQMMYMMEWECIIFLATPLLENPDAMFRAGLYINDLSMHDSSRDLVLAGTQQSAELKLALDQVCLNYQKVFFPSNLKGLGTVLEPGSQDTPEQQKSKILEESMKKLDAEMKRTDSLLYQMIPKPVADRLRRGEPAITTCQVFDNVTILFSDVVGFTTICSQISPMEVVCMLNAMYTKFDQLSERHGVYKVETIGDAYMVVSGAPEITKFHAVNICNMALDMMSSMVELSDPSTGSHMRIRVGIHSGTTVAGVVGIKMPRYCLFGDTVNTASRMETNGEAMKIHISQITREHLAGHPYRVEERGSIPIKGKGSMKTFWLLSLDDKINDVIEEKRNTSTPRANDVVAYDTRSLYSPISFDDVQKAKSVDTSLDFISQHARNNSMELSSLNKRNRSLDLSSHQKGSESVDLNSHIEGIKSVNASSRMANSFVSIKNASNYSSVNGDTGVDTKTVLSIENKKQGYIVDEKGKLPEDRSALCEIL